jgi:hypothetical protein
MLNCGNLGIKILRTDRRKRDGIRQQNFFIRETESNNDR